MNKRKTIYRGFNKRRKTRHIQVIVITASICLISGYGIYRVKDSNILENISKKVSFIKLENPFKKDSDFLGYEDYKIEPQKNDEQAVEKVENEKQEIKEKEVAEDVKLARVEPWSIYTVQVASVSNDKDLNKIETQLVEKKIPFSVVEIDGAKKVQTHGYFDQESTRSHINEVKDIFPDAFLSELKVPVLAIEYTSKYSYVESITKQLNSLIKNFEQESAFWQSSKENVDIKKYNDILAERKEIVSNIEKEGKKINYSEMNVFKDNLLNYTKNLTEKVEMALKSANDKNYNVSESMYLSSMQEYFSFINSIKKA
ncbi:hypothetical protein [Romboutsia lituseburensis]|uniref:hypothetical protein n=1 Tax=Romboutsia lituseburensis TaxID=1537 RepID=UPI00215B1106|nr:hypothetical protein [Romboutsia lituseburensis]MCR8746491.1 hypothetical protein [Romboutsia lituseburensis]